jgi:hypothetical protein
MQQSENNLNKKDLLMEQKEESWDGMDTWWGWRKIENQDKY